MTDKEQIIINGVDVSECEYLTYQLEEDGEYYWFCDIAPAGGPDECEYKPECFYKRALKQLARKTQECEQIKEKYEALKLENEEGYEIVAELKQECEELKRVNIILQNRNQQLDGATTEAIRYRKALEEIEEVIKSPCAEDCVYYEPSRCYDCIKTSILDIISKAKGEENAE